MDSRCTALALSFMVSITSSKTETCKHTNCQTITPSTRTYNLWKTRFNKVLTFRSKFHTTPVIYLGHHGRFFCLATRQQKVEKRSEKSVDFKEIFKQGTAEIDERFKGRWLKGIPNLSQECEATTLSSVVGEEIDIAGETFQVNKTETFEEVAELLTPKFLPGDFPLDITSSGISRILLRQEFIERWNGQIRSLGNQKVVRYPKWIILSAASGLGKSIDLYLAAVFARYCKIPVQYFGNTSAILRDPQNDSFVALRFLKMLLFMNADVLDNIKKYFVPSCSQYFLLTGLPLKKVIYFALVKRDLYLCRDIRDTMMRLSTGNLLIVDEHNALWRNSPVIQHVANFFSLYNDIQMMSMNSCGVLIAGSQHHMFEDSLQSGYDSCVKYVEPLNSEEYHIWTSLQDYPSILRLNSPRVIELTGAVPRMIAKMVSLCQDSITSFDKVESNFTEDVSLVMKRSHDKYVESLKSSSVEDSFSDMLRALFLDKSAPPLSVAHGAYRDRGLLISMNDRSLKFYNSIARNILFSTFLRFWAKSEYIAKLSDRYITETGSEKGYAFEAIFFLWCLLNKPFFEIRAQNEMGTVRFEQSRWLKLQGHNFDPTVEKVTRSCWLKFTETHARLDLAYIDMESSNWNIYFMQLSISSFSQHNRGSAEIQRLFDPPERPQLASLLETIFGETGFQVSVIRDDSNQIVDFEVLDPNGMSCRNRITILYVTPLSESDVGISSAPKFIGFLTFESYPKAFQQLLGMEPKKKAKKRHRNV
eukprot:jgi/Galph1/4051/GphlegSOOS_G2744.1